MRKLSLLNKARKRQLAPQFRQSKLHKWSRRVRFKKKRLKSCHLESHELNIAELNLEQETFPNTISSNTGKFVMIKVYRWTELSFTEPRNETLWNRKWNWLRYRPGSASQQNIPTSGHVYVSDFSPWTNAKTNQHGHFICNNSWVLQWCLLATLAS